MKGLVVVVPCYNEEKRLDTGAFHGFVDGGFPGRFLFVNDGSKDGTLGVLEGLAAANPGAFSVLDVQPNGGKAEAVRRGMVQAFAEGAEVAGFWDADLATPLEAIPQFYDALMGDDALDMVIGSRVRLLGRAIERQAIRHYLGRFGATMASLALGLPVYDTQCGAKLFRNVPRVQGIFADGFIANWMFDVELLARYINTVGSEAAAAQGVYELPLMNWQDVAGSKVTAQDFPKAFGELASIYWHYRR